MSKNIKRVLIVEDFERTREIFQELIDSEEDFEVCGVVGNIEDFRSSVKSKKPDVVVLDINLPERSNTKADLTKNEDNRGLREGLRLKGQRPQIGVLFISALLPDRFIDIIVDSSHPGGLGFVSKRVTNEKFLFTLREVSAGKKSIDSETSLDLWKPKPTSLSAIRDIFSEREKEVLSAVAIGYTSVEIGEELSISSKTVDNDLRKIRWKLQDHEITIGGNKIYRNIHLTHLAIGLGLIDRLPIETNESD